MSSICVACLSACAREAIEWREPVHVPASLANATDIEFDSQKRLAAKATPAVALPVFTGQCAGSVRVARDGAGEWYATWWSARPDSTAEIVVSRSSNDASWTPPVRVDTTDVGRIGCQRAPPSIAADSGVVHVVYAMTAREGPGIFASHAMDQGMTFHSPVAVVYGERIGLTAVAARGNLVAVAYEDPNTNPQRIGVAFSRTMGHPFDVRQLVSSTIEVARDPRVALSERTIAVTWARGTSSDPAAPRVLRIGELR